MAYISAVPAIFPPNYRFYGSSSSSGPHSPCSYHGHDQSSNWQPQAGALMLWQPNTLHGLFFDEDLHGPFATGMKRNPFTPGLDPLSTASSSTKYQTQDPLKDKYPAQRLADDPLNWISEELFHVSEERKVVSEQRAPLRSLSAK